MVHQIHFKQHIFGFHCPFNKGNEKCLSMHWVVYVFGFGVQCVCFLVLLKQIGVYMFGYKQYSSFQNAMYEINCMIICY